MKVKVSGKGTAYGEVSIGRDMTVLELKKQIQKNLLPRAHPTRQRLMIDGRTKRIPLDDTKLISDYFDNDQVEAEVIYKDLGPQLYYRTVYIWEYLGPLVLYPVIALVPPLRGLIFGASAANPEVLSDTQLCALFLWIIHYVKRLLESIFLHKFGTHSMPLFNLFKNCAYYWGFGIAVAYDVNRPSAPSANPQFGSWHLMVGFLWFSICMFFNFMCHVRLASLRSSTSNEYVLPHGGLFEYIVCPNYFCEILMWVGFNILTGFPFMGIAFNIVGALQMLQWAKKRREKYEEKFGSKFPKKRYTLFPFIY